MQDVQAAGCDPAVDRRRTHPECDQLNAYYDAVLALGEDRDSRIDAPR
jgi:hypothetical protein